MAVESHYYDLIDIAFTQKEQYSDGIPTSTVASVLPRSDGTSIFEEGEKLGGVYEHGKFESTLTIVPAPHVQPNIPREAFVDRVKTTLNPNAIYPRGFSDAELIAPHMVVW